MAFHQSGHGQTSIAGCNGIHANLWWNYAWGLITLYVIVRLLQSNTGNVLKAIRDDETAAKAMNDGTPVSFEVVHEKSVKRQLN